MKKSSTYLGLLFCLVSSSAFSLTGREIMDKSTSLTLPESGRSDITMKIKKGSSIEEKLFTVEAKKNGDKEAKILVTFSKPNKIKFLVHTHKNGEEDRWLKLSSGGIKRFGGTDGGGSFVNSHFVYDDISGSRSLDDYDFNLLGEEKIGADDVHKVEAVRKKGQGSYEKATYFVRKSDYVGLKVDFYQKGKIIKTLESSDIKEIKGIKTPHKVVMKMADSDDYTELTITKLEYGVIISDSIFRKESL